MNAYREPGSSLRHGYTLDNVDQLARSAISRSRGVVSISASDGDERYAVAWDAIATHLFTADDPPSGYELTSAALAALRADSSDFRRHHGRRDNTRAFEAFWLDTGGPTPSPERGVIERTALAQIWSNLQPSQQRVLTARATFDDYQTAADALGLSYKAFATAISRARREFLRMWHEGEEPSRPWGNDRRRSEGTRRDAVTQYVNRRGRKKPKPLHGKASTYRSHRCRCTPCKRAAADSTTRSTANRQQAAVIACPAAPTCSPSAREDS